jgi:hypothetical protein
LEIQMRRTVLPLIALLPLALTACGHAAQQQPRASSFTAGTCRVAAPDVLAIGKAGTTIRDAHKVDAAVRTSLREAQARLRELADAAEPPYQPSLDALVVSAGFVRIRADGNTYDPSVGRQLMTDYRAVLRACSAT